MEAQAMTDFEQIQGELVAFGDRYGKMGFAVALLNTVLLLIILFK
jgi:hypothetical protein